MNVLFLNNGRFAPANSHTMYSDLMREFHKNGHDIYIVCANERRFAKVPEYYVDEGIHCVCVRIGNLTKCSIPEKALTMATISNRYIYGIRKYYSKIRFDLVLYPTPPISFLGAVDYIKKRDGAKSYLLLKDIFPQNAVDIGIIQKTGIDWFIYKYYRKQEKRLYNTSNFIGCMSQANVDYVIKHNPEIDNSIIEICPNCVDVQDKSVDVVERKKIRERYQIPDNKVVFVYGGNLGKPQGIPFLIECFRKCKHLDNAFFLIVGEGTDFSLIDEYIRVEQPANIRLLKRIPKDDYDTMIGACDVGLISLDHRFTIPNFPSRLLSYMQAKLPVLAVTDPNTDIGKVIEQGGFGWWIESNNSDLFVKTVQKIIEIDLDKTQAMEFQYLIDHYSVGKVYKTIVSHF